jgi:acyl-CoA-binding protein
MPIAGRSSQTPTIIIRLTSLSMRSHAVSTRDIGVAAAALLVNMGRFRAPTRRRRVARTIPIPEDPDMANLKASFEKAVADSKKLPERPDNATLLQIYALYKQATDGDVQGSRPGFIDMVGRAKWDAWKAVEGKTAKDAMQAYVDLIESLK